MMWAAAKGASLRRVIVEGSLELFGLTSAGQSVQSDGGFLADSYISGQIRTGSQIEFMSRNVFTSNWDSDH